MSNYNDSSENEELVTQSDLLGMGLTKSIITKFLPEPILRTNPRYKCAAPMKLWKLEEVKKIMEQEDFKEAMVKAKKEEKKH